MNPRIIHSAATLGLAASISLAAATAPDREVPRNQPRHEIKARAFVETCSSDAIDDSSSSSRAAESSNGSALDEGIERKSENSTPPADNRPPE